MIAAVLSGFFLTLLIILLGKRFKSQWSLMLSVLPLGLFVYFCLLLVSKSDLLLYEYQWVPQLDINLVFKADGLSLLFALMISGIGSLVFIYTSYYLKNHPYLNRFYAYLSMFMAAMLGLVLSDNLISLFIFWELTSISSFFLIGFNNQEKASRQSALTALGITGIGGLFLLAAALLTAQAGGTYSIAELTSNDSLREHTYYVPILLCFLMAAFTKSAQFPFHFWLPGAMKAPTPVSTYLHSATMVKAGIYLLLRISPFMSGHELWSQIILPIGMFTMLYAAFHSLFRTDMKGILAYSTIAALGILTALIGLGTAASMLAALVFIIVHALYKAALFLITGIVDHETGTRDVSKLSGLGKLMLPVALAGFVAAVSNAGIPPSVGFVGKDLIYEASLHAPDWPWLWTVAFIISNILLLYVGFLVGIKPFVGSSKKEFEQAKTPSWRLYVPTLLLAFGSITFGLAPYLLENFFIASAMKSIGFAEHIFHLKLWHGFNLILALSAITIFSGIALYFIIKPSHKKLAFIERYEFISPKSILEKLATSWQRVAEIITDTLQHGYLRNYVLLIIIYFLLVVGYQSIKDLEFSLYWAELSQLTFYEVLVLGIMFLAVIFTVSSKSRLAAISAMGIVGLAMCLIFVYYSAPDLAMTQFLIDTLTVILFVLVLYRLPPYLNLTETKTKIRDGIVAIGLGLMITFLALAVLDQPDYSMIGDYYADNAYVKAKGKNVVNVILVDYRGLDTLVEGIVLSIAAIGVFGLMKLRVTKSDQHLLD